MERRGGVARSRNSFFQRFGLGSRERTRSQKPRQNRRIWTTRAAGLVFALVTAAALGPALSSGCSWDPRHPFERNAPEVEEAIQMIESGQYESAEQVLGKYLGTGVCGGLTTFSTMQVETLKMIEQHHYGLAIGYTCASIVLGLLAVHLASALVRRAAVR